MDRGEVICFDRTYPPVAGSGERFVLPPGDRRLVGGGSGQAAGATGAGAPGGGPNLAVPLFSAASRSGLSAAS
ncbi:MAG: hypothetical protein NVSMB16_07760 [Acidimicrobiales bacterium]